MKPHTCQNTKSASYDKMKCNVMFTFGFLNGYPTNA